MVKAMCFGEAMIRFSTCDNERFEQARRLELSLAGAESNFAIAFTKLGGQGAFASVLPDSPLGRWALNEIRKDGVDVSDVLMGKGRMGLYFVEQGKKPRMTKVVYDRKNSAFANAEEFSTDLEYDIVHTTGITLALSDRAREEAYVLFERAQKKGTTTSFDMNYREKLWSTEEALKAAEPILYRTDILFSTIEDVRRVFEIDKAPQLCAEELNTRYSIPTVVITMGKDGALCLKDGELFRENGYDVEAVDRIGAGDAFDAAFTLLLLEKKDAGLALRYAVAAAAIAHTIKGDVFYASRDEIEEVLGLRERCFR